MLPILKAISDWTRQTPKLRSNTQTTDNFKLVKTATHFESSDEVMRFLPDILGRALARCWIDRAFMSNFLQHPRAVLARYSVYLPQNVVIEVEIEGVTRPKIVVYEMGALGKRKRLMYLQLVMMAGK